MIQAINEAAFSPYLTPQSLWRSACPWESHDSDQADWLKEMAVDLLDIRELPEVRHPHEYGTERADF